jgi:hypothetical protein
MYHACMHTRPPARSASRAAAPPPKVALFALEDNQSSAEALELTASIRSRRARTIRSGASLYSSK